MKIWLMALLISQTAMALTTTSKQDCSSLDLRDDFLGEVRNQKKISWCYAFAGADMLAHAYQIPEKISAADVAIAYNETKIGKLVRWLDVNIINPKDPEIRKLAHQTGFNKSALITSMKEGWCPERVFSSEQWTKVTKTDEGLKEEQVPLDQAMLEISALHDIRKSLSTENLPYHYSFKNVDAESFVQLLQSKTLPRFYSSLRQLVCRDDRRPFDQVEKVKMLVRFPGIFKRISDQLEGGQVVGLDYDSRILQDSANHSVKISQLHTSSIVGRRWNTERNTCEFLIRNSHGDKCGPKYDSTYDCESGNIWLGESQIFKSMTSIVYILSEEN